MDQVNTNSFQSPGGFDVALCPATGGRPHSRVGAAAAAALGSPRALASPGLVSPFGPSPFPTSVPARAGEEDEDPADYMPFGGINHRRPVSAFEAVPLSPGVIFASPCKSPVADSAVAGGENAGAGVAPMQLCKPKPQPKFQDNNRMTGGVQTVGGAESTILSQIRECVVLIARGVKHGDGIAYASIIKWLGGTGQDAATALRLLQKELKGKGVSEIQKVDMFVTYNAKNPEVMRDFASATFPGRFSAFDDSQNYASTIRVTATEIHIGSPTSRHYGTNIAPLPYHLPPPASAAGAGAGAAV